MLESIPSAVEEPDERLVRDYLAALNHGQLIDALSAFSMDASFRDQSGREKHGIREIAEAFVRQERPVRVEIEDLQREGDAVSVRVRMSTRANRGPRTYRSVFHVSRNRIHSLEIDPIPTARHRSKRTSRTE